MNFNVPFERQESYVKDSKTKLIWLSLCAVFVICGILMAIFHPEAEFTWLFDSCKYYLGLFILALLCLFVWMGELGEKRDEKYYFTPEGKLDLSTPRIYTKLKRPKLFEIFNRGGLDEFAYDGEGNVHLVTTKGKTITAPLSDLTVSYTMDKAGRDDYRIYKMTVISPEGEKIKFTTGSTMLPFPSLMESEYDDIHMILSAAGTVNETKMSKANKWIDKVKSAYDDLDFSGFIGKSGGDSADTKIVEFVKSKLGLHQKKKSWFKKLVDNFLLVVAFLYLFAILIVNIANLPEIFGGSDEYYYDEEYEEMPYEEEMQYEENTQQDEVDCSLKGKIGNRDYMMNLKILSQMYEDEDGTQFNVIGKVVQPYEADIIGTCIRNEMEINIVEVYEQVYINAGTLKGEIIQNNRNMIYKGYEWVEGECIPFSFQILMDSSNYISQDVEKYTLHGKIDAKYPIEMLMLIEENEVIEAVYRYLKTGSGDWIQLEISKNNLGQTIMTEIINGEENGEFEGRIVFEKNKIEYKGWFTNFKSGKNYIFYVEN